MNIDIRSIGNSKGIILPRAMLKQCQLQDSAEIEVVDGKIIISRPQAAPRKGWAEAFQRTAKTGDDHLIDEAPATAFDQAEWTW